MQPDLERVRELLQRFDGRRVLILGDAMLDHYIWGETTRISPEAPIPVVTVRRESSRLGGAANVAHNVRRLGGEPVLLSVIGEDEAGVQLKRVLEERAIDTSGLVTDPERPTIKKTRVIARSQQVVRIDRESDGALGDDARGRFSEAIAAELERADAIVISDYGKGLISERLLDQWLPRFIATGHPVCVDPKETHFHRYRGVTVLTPNVHEASFAAGTRVRDEETLEEVGRQLLRQLHARHLLITRGEAGMSLFTPDHERCDIPSAGREVYDVTGAGDTVVGALALALAAGASMEEATRIANQAAGVVIRELGTATVTREELLESWAAIEGGREQA
ncbi:MAG: D-glycero-beta-D-manno-heptose-7-phosphate kinase [Candidatus Eisenbacteria sp.]|nr:D-glycero-beta-D-manno-heptose-7-phosphate kinase [Candidatus Eisenbacteria bacterium]